MDKLLENVTTNSNGPIVKVTDGRNYCIAMDAATVFNGCTITLEVSDRDTQNVLYTDPALYQLTDLTDAFEIALAPGMQIQAKVTSAGASTSIPLLALYKYED